MKAVRWFVVFGLWFAVATGQDKATLLVKSDSASVLVYIDSVFIGTTPLQSVSIDTGKHVLRFIHSSEVNWYQPPVLETLHVKGGERIERLATIPVYEYQPHVLSKTWQKAAGGDSLAIPQFALEGKNIPSATPLYLTTAGAVISGTVAVYFKLQADNYYEDYQTTGDEALLDKVKTNDTVSGIALAACEINLIALTYFLLSR